MLWRFEVFGFAGSGWGGGGFPANWFPREGM